MRDVTIHAVLNGWTATVGCQTLVYTDADKLVGDLKEFLVDPEKKEKAMTESAVNKRLLREPQLAMPQMQNTLGGCATEASMPQELRRQ